jgi:alcohol dehydrogenase (NADP+)
MSMINRFNNRYGTEKAVGKAIKESGVPRSELFLTTKLWNHKHHPEDVEASLDESLKNLGTDYVDLYLIHWPGAFERGDNLFPKKGDKLATADIDYVDVSPY